MCCHFSPQHSMATCFEFFCLYWQGPVKALWQMSWFKETASAHLQYFTARDQLGLDEKGVGREEKATFSQRGGRLELRTQIRRPCQRRLWGSASPSRPGYLSLIAILPAPRLLLGKDIAACIVRGSDKEVPPSCLNWGAVVTWDRSDKLFLHLERE